MNEETATTASRARQLGSALDRSSVAFVELDLAGVVRCMSVGAATLIGLDPDDAIGADWLAFVHPSDRAGIVEGWRALSDRSAVTVDRMYRTCHRDGRHALTEARFHSGCDAAGEPDTIIGILHDVSSRTERAGTDTASAEISRILVASVVDYAVYLLDLDGTVRSWNPGAQRIKGYRADEIIGTNFSVFYTEEDNRAGAPLRALEITRTLGRFESEGWRVRKDGTRLWASIVIDVVRNVSGEVVGFANIVRDTTPNVRASEFDEHNAVSGQGIVDNIVDYAMYVLDLDGTIKSWNPGAERIKGYRANEIVGSNFSNFFTDEDVSAGEPMRSLDVARTTGLFETRGWRRRRDGSCFRAAVVIDAVRDAAGEVTGFTNITRDITQSAALRKVSEETGSIAQTLVDNIVDYGIYLLDSDGCVKSWNPGAQRIKGYAAEEIIGRHFRTFFTDDDIRAGEPARALALARDTGRYRSEGWRVRKNRTRFWASVTLDAVRDTTGAVVGFAKITRDVTQSVALEYVSEQLRIEREQFLVAKRSADEATARLIVGAERDRLMAASLTEKNRLWAMAGELARIGYWHFDPVASTVTWSEEIYRILGLPRSYQPQLDSAIELYHPDHRATVRTSLERAIAEGSPVAFEAQIQHASGAYRDVTCRGHIDRREDGTVRGIFGVFQDVTDRKNAERESERLTGRIMLATQAARIGIWEWDLGTGKLVWDPMMYALYDVSSADTEPCYAWWIELLHADDRARVRSEAERALSDGAAYDTEFRVVSPGGEVRHIRATATVVRDGDGRPVRLVGTNWDVSEARNLAEALRATAEHDRATAATLRETNRLMALAEEISHVGYWRLDVASGALHWSDEVYRIFGLPRSVEPWLALTLPPRHPDAWEWGKAQADNAISSVLPYRAESQIARPDGSLRSIVSSGQPECDASGKLVALVGICQDVTAAKDAARDRERLIARVNIATRAARVGIWDWDIVTGEIDWDAMMFELYGLESDDVAPAYVVWARSLHVDDRVRVQRTIRESAANGTRWEDEFRIVLADGKIRHICAMANVVCGPDGRPQRMIGTNSDVTELRTLAEQLRRNADRERETTVMLREQTRLMSMAEETACIGHWRLDVAAGELHWSNEVYRTHGQPLTYRPTLNSALDHYHPDDRERVRALVGDALQTATPFTYESRVVRPDGSIRDVLASGQSECAPDGSVIAVFGVFQDVTELMEAEREGSRLLERLTVATAAGRVGVWDWDLAHDVVVWDANMFALYGVPAQTEPLTSAYWQHQIHPADAAAVTQAVEAALRSGSPLQTEYRIHRPTGEVRYIQAHASVLCDETGTAIRMVGASWDVSEVRELTAQLELEKERLLETVDMWMAAKLLAEETTRAKTDFLANMSHEIRTPMNGILGLTALLLDGDIPPAEQHHHLSVLADAGRSLLAIINDILDLSKVEAGKIDLESIALSPAALVDGAVSIVRPSALEKDLTLEIDVAPNVPAWVSGDPTRLRQILLNLLTNAIKFTERGGVRVTVELPSDGRSGFVRFEVSDTGIGIPPERQYLLFEKFSQVDPSDARKYGGTGLGLAICKRLAEAMSGSIGMTSTVGTGSAFWFTAALPIAAAPVVAQITGRRSSDVVTQRILVADDNPINQMVVKGLLKKDGHEVTLAADGAEALAAVQDRSFDLVLMDMQMPVMDGLEATRRIRALGGAMGELPIIALTANAMSDQVARCRAAGMNEHLAKPIERETLRRAIAKWTAPVDPKPVSVEASFPNAREATTGSGPAACEFDPAWLLELFNGDWIAVADLLRIASPSIEDDLRAIEAGVDAHDARVVIEAAHRLKGSCGDVGATRLRDLAARIETTAKQSSWTIAPELLVELRRVGGRIGAEIDELAKRAHPRTIV